MDNEELDGMVMSTLETFDVAMSDEYNRETLEMLDAVGDNDTPQSWTSAQVENENRVFNNTLWDYPGFNDVSHWMDNMDVDEHLMGNSEFTMNSLCKGMLFASKEDVIYACQKYSILNRVEYYTYKSDVSRLILHCRDGASKCAWLVRAVKKSKVAMWEISRYGEGHTCEKDIIPKDNTHFNKSFIAKEINGIIREKLRLTPRAIKHMMFKKFGYDIPYVKAWKARQKALKDLFGDWKTSFEQLPHFMNILQFTNPGSAVFWQTSPLQGGNVSVDRVFWAFAPAIQAFVHCRPVICIDGTHLYGKYKGVLLVAVGVDANNHIIPLAYALVESENNDSWSWFMCCLRAGVTDRKELCVISDRHIGIVNAMKLPDWAPPMAYHRVCSRHLVSNFNMRVKNKQLKDFLARIAHQNQKKKFIKLFSDLREKLKEQC